jgi:hypothetical protein
VIIIRPESMSAIEMLRQLTPAPPVAHTLSRVVASDHTPIGIRRNVRVHPGPSGRIFDTIDRKLEEVEWRLNYARNVNKPIPVASAITTKKVNAPRRLTPMRLLNPGTHHQRTKSAHVPEINLEAGSPPLAVRFLQLGGASDGRPLESGECGGTRYDRSLLRTIPTSTEPDITENICRARTGRALARNSS